MKARIPKHREFIIDFPQDMDQAKADEGWNKLNEIVEEYKKAQTARASTLRPSLRTASLPSRSCRRSTVSSTRSRKSSDLHRRTTASAGFWFTRM